MRALFISTSSLPKCRVVAATTAAQPSSLVTSSGSNRAGAPMASATCRPSRSSTSAITTLAPSRANMRAVAAPMPDAAPEMMATLFASLMVSPLLLPCPYCLAAARFCAVERKKGAASCANISGPSSAGKCPPHDATNLTRTHVTRFDAGRYQDETVALAQLLRRTIEEYCYPLSPLPAPLNAILEKLGKAGIFCRTVPALSNYQKQRDRLAERAGFEPIASLARPIANRDAASSADRHFCASVPTPPV